MKSPFILCLLVAVWATLGSGCYTVPVTGRTALNLASDTEVARLSVEAFEEMKGRYPVSRNKEQIARVNRIGERLSRVAFWDVPSADWEFVVFDAPGTINAFAMAGGKVGVFSGLFTVAQTDDELASVLAHEIAHVSARHVHERLSQQGLLQAGGLAVGIAMAGTGAPAITSNAVLEAYGLSTGVGGLAFDRNKEREADKIGLIYMAQAGYNPEASITVLERLDSANAGRAGPPAWLSTHPSTPDRILRIMDAMPEARKAYKEAGNRPEPTVIK